MKRILKNLLVVLLFCLSLVVIVGCNKRKDPTVIPSEQTEPIPSEKTQEKVEIEVKFNGESNPTIYVGDVIDVKVKNINNGTEYTEYQVFFNDDTILKYESGKLVALKAGSVDVTFVINIGDDNYRTNKNLVVIEKTDLTPIDPTVPTEQDEYTFETNIPDTMYSFQTVKDITLTLNPGNINITDFKVKVSNSDIIDYMSDNSIEAIDNGTVSITFTFTYEGKELSYTKEVVVSGELGLKVTYEKEVFVGDKIDVKVYVTPTNEEIINYTIRSTSQSVSIENLEIQAIAEGDAIVYLNTEYLGTNLSDTLKIKVKKAVVQTLRTNLVKSMFLNEEFEVCCYLYPSMNDVASFTVKSSDESKISVDGKKIKALNNGTATIEVQYEEYNYSIDVTVSNIENVKLNIKNELYLNEVAFYELLSVPNDLVIENISYSVGNNDVLLANKNAVFANSLGESTLTISYKYLDNNYSDTVTIKVLEKTYPIERITLTGSNGLLIGTTTQLNVTKFPNNGVGEIEYSSSDNNVLSVDSNGLVTGLKTGEAVVTVSVKDTLIKQEIAIKVIDKNDDVYINGGEYKEDKILRYNELSLGVLQKTYWSYTRTANAGIDVDGYTGLNEIIDVNEWYSQCVNILEVPSSKELKVIPWANLNGNVWNLTSVRGLIDNFEKYNPGMKVIAAVNGDFFDINATRNLPYSTTGENISDGEFYKSSNGFGPDGGTIGFTNDGSNLTLIGGYGATRTALMVLAVYDSNGNIIHEFDNISYNDDSSTTSVWYGTYNSDKEYVPKKVTCDRSVFVVEQADRAVPSYDNDFYGKGTITLKKEAQDNDFELQVGQFAIKTVDNNVIEALSKEKTKIRVQFQYTGEWANVKSATGYNQKVYDDSYEVGGYEGSNLGTRAPRTVIGMKEDGTLVMMVVDGRQGAAGMFGCDGWECSAIMKAYGCVKAYNVDGGGSTTMVIRTEDGLQVLNSPSDGHERSDGNCILICSVDPNYKTYVNETTSSTAKISVTTDVSEFSNYQTVVKCNGEFFDTVDGVATITGLVHNQFYSYQVYYKDGDNLIKTLSVGSFTTQKSGFEFLGVLIEETDNSFVIKAYAIDPDNSSNVSSMSITKNGYNTKLTDGVITLKKDLFGSNLDDLVLSFYYIEDGKTQSITLNANDCYIK